uniref:Rhomboid protein Hedne_PARL n=1 Tax=Hedera nepalensis TaxID=85358 RepID=A0A0A7E6R8_9APIA|nr:rhomboid protein Hedne_PARL [Hedera nepalensis]
MQRLLSLVSKNPRNLSNSSNSFLSFSKTNPIQPQNAHGHFISHYTTLLHSCPKPKKFFGFLSNPVLVKQLLPNSNALLKGPSKGLLDIKVGFLKTQFPRRNYHYGSSYKSRSSGWRWIQRLDSNQVVLGLIVTNVAVFFLWRVADRQFMRKNFMISVDNFRSGRVHTLITSAFSHIDTGHLISNMIGLYFFGTSIGRVFGPEFVLTLYLSGAVAGSVFYLVYHAFMSSSLKSKQMWSIDPANIPGLGASGAVNAIMLLDIFLHPRNTLYLEFIIPVPAILLGIFIIGKDLLRIIEGDPQVSGSAHLGGAAVAAIAWALCRKRGLY